MSDKTRVYEVWSYSQTFGGGKSATVEGEYGNEQDARDAAEFYASDTTRTEVLLRHLTKPDTYDVVWSSDE